MIHVKDRKQVDMFHPFEHLGPKRLALLESSWAHLFREKILHKLPVEKLCPRFDDVRGRPTRELYARLGIVPLQQMEDLTDEEAVRQFAFNILWHYALNVTDPSDFSSCVSPRTLWAMRDRAGRLGLEQPLFANVTGALRRLFDLDPSWQRLDSVHIFSNMAHLGRIRLFVKTIRKFLVNLKRHHAGLCQALGEVYRFRAGAEAAMSNLDRVTGIKHLRVRGMRQVRLAAVLKAAGLNILRAAVFRNRQKPKETRKTGTNLYPNGAVSVLKVPLRPLRGYLRHLAEAFRPGNNRIGWLMPHAA